MRGVARAAGLLLCGSREGGPALGGDPAGNEHLHESHRPHATCCRWTLTPTTGAGSGTRRGGGTPASEGAGPGWGWRGLAGGGRGAGGLPLSGDCSCVGTACSGSDSVSLCPVKCGAPTVRLAAAVGVCLSLNGSGTVREVMGPG